MMIELYQNEQDLSNLLSTMDKQYKDILENVENKTVLETYIPQLIDIDKEISEIPTSLDQLKIIKDELTNTLTEKQDQLAQKQNELHNAEEQLATTEAKITQVKADITACEDGLKDLIRQENNNRYLAIINEYEAKEADLDTKKTDKANKEQDLENINNNITTKEGEINTLKGQISTKEEEIRALQTLISELENAKTAGVYPVTVEGVEYATEEELDVAITAKQQELAAKQSELNDLVNDLATKNSELEALKRQKTDIEREINDLTTQITELEKYLNDNRAAYDNAKASLDPPTQKEIIPQETIDRKRKELNAEKAAKEIELEELEATKSQQIKVIDGLETDIAELEKEIAVVQREIDEIDAEIAKLEDLEATKAEITSEMVKKIKPEGTIIKDVSQFVMVAEKYTALLKAIDDLKQKIADYKKEHGITNNICTIVMNYSEI